MLFHTTIITQFYKGLGKEFQRDGGHYGERSVASHLVLGPWRWRQEVGISGAEAAGWSMVVLEQVSEVAVRWCF